MAKAAKRTTSAGPKFTHKVVDGKVYVPCLYHGKYRGHGYFIAASLKMEKAELGDALHGPLLCDDTGRPIPYQKL